MTAVYRTPTVERTVFATPRAAEFLELRALQAQTGQPVEAFGHVVVKELLDNALDAAETAGRAPNIDITTRTDDGITFVTVTDNGAGIAPATVDDVCDFTVLVSDKAATAARRAARRATHSRRCWASPTRSVSPSRWSSSRRASTTNYW